MAGLLADRRRSAGFAGVALLMGLGWLVVAVALALAAAVVAAVGRSVRMPLDLKHA